MSVTHIVLFQFKADAGPGRRPSSMTTLVLNNDRCSRSQASNQLLDLKAHMRAPRDQGAVRHVL